MQRVAFTMRLFKDSAAEYKRRHDLLWPELAALLKQAGIQHYSIFIDETTDTLFGYLTVSDVSKMESLSKEAVMQKWWKYMSDIMETKQDRSPLSVALKEVFYLR